MRIIIRAVPERVEYIRYLQRHLPEAEWCFDLYRDAWETFERALRLGGDDPVIHMEEDVLLTTGFREKVAAVVADKPGSLIQFFSRRGDDIERGSRWDSWYSYNVCTYYPPGYAAQLLAFAPDWRAAHPQHPTGYDLMIDDWLKSRGEPYWLSVPSLVQHREGRSAINPRRARRRQSATFVDALP